MSPSELPPMGGPASEDMRRAFGRALHQVMREADVNAPQLAGTLDLHPDAVRKWVDGQSEPKHPLLTFAVERQLDLTPGSLSHHLGYVPAGAPSSVEEAVAADRRLNPLGRSAVLGTYRAVRS